MTEGTMLHDRAAEFLIPAVASEAAEHARTWFPDLGEGPVRVRLRDARPRSRCLLYRLDVHDDRLAHPVMVKVRHSDPSLRPPDVLPQRPILAPVRTMSDHATARREYDGLLHIRDAIEEQGDPDRRFGCLRPLAWLPEHSAIVTDYLHQPTLRTALQATSRLHLHGHHMPNRPWENAGAWLRLFHQRQTPFALPLRASTAAEVGELFSQFAGCLIDRIGPRPLLEDLRTSGVDIARAAFPPVLPTGTGHGDFVANNMFVSPEGRITVFDPLPLWRVPVYQDLATMTVGLRVLWSQAMTRGLCLPRSALDRYEAALYRGYFGDRPPPRKALRAFELLVLLDRWLSLVTRGSRRSGLRPSLRRARIRVFSGHYHDEARFLSRQLAT
jgi:hypothetical protein